MMEVDISLLRPLWLLGLPLLAGGLWWVFKRQGGVGDWQRAADPGLLRAMAALGRVDQGGSRLPLITVGAALALMVIALSGPAIERRDTLTWRNLDSVLFVQDSSDSVTTHDRWPQMQTMGRFGLAALGTRPGGLVVFGGDAYVASDVTLDHEQLGQTYSLIGPDTVPDPGSRPAAGLALADRLLAQGQVLAGDVILLTDGAGLGPASLRAAEVLAARGARLSLVSLEAPSGAMRAHAQIGGGTVFTLDQTAELSDWLQQESRTRLELQNYPLLYWRDLGRFILLAALVPLLLLFRRQGA